MKMQEVININPWIETITYQSDDVAIVEANGFRFVFVRIRSNLKMISFTKDDNLDWMEQTMKMAVNMGAHQNELEALHDAFTR